MSRDKAIDTSFSLVKCKANVFVYELWRVSVRASPNRNGLWEIRRIFQVKTHPLFLIHAVQEYFLSFYLPYKNYC